MFRRRLQEEDIKVARALGWKHRRGTVEYVITVNGPEAVSMRTAKIDYGWYATAQILPVARSAGIAAGFWLAPLLTKFAGFPTLISNASVLLAFSVSAVIGIIFGFFPALKAANLDPIEALRYE